MSNAKTTPRPHPPDDAAVDRALTDLGIAPDRRDRLRRYAELLVHWQPRINLVGPATLAELWWRHMLDSAQLLPLLPSGCRSLIDLGSGAGFPGLVLAILGVPDVHLIERDRRKAIFLRQVSRETRTAVTVHNDAIERVGSFAADAITARALAGLDRLLPLAARFAGPETVCVFPKGRQVEKELTCLGDWPSIRVERRTSLSDSAATVLVIKGLGRGRGHRGGATEDESGTANR